MNNKLLFGSGWYDIEIDTIGHPFIWTGKEAELILNDNHVRCIDLIFNSDKYTPKKMVISHGNFKEEYTLTSGVNSFRFYPDLSLKSNSKILLTTPEPFCPKDEITNSNDIRELGQRLISINIDGVGIDISSILSSARMFEINPNVKFNSLNSLGIFSVYLTSSTESVDNTTIKELRPILFNKADIKSNRSLNEFITYYMLLRNVLSYTENHICIIEHGVKPIPNFNEYFPAFFKSIPDSWDVIYVGYDSIENVKIIVNSKINSGTPDNFKIIILNKSIISKVVDKLTLSEESFNSQLKTIIETDRLKSYLFTPSLAI